MNMQIDKELWNRVVIDNFGSPFHSWEWMRTQSCPSSEHLEAGPSIS